MLLESVRSALERRGYDVTAPEPTSTSADVPDRWRPPDVLAEGDDALACWVVDQVDPSTVIRAQAAARSLSVQPVLAGGTVDDGAQPWARRYGVEVLDADALENGAGVNGSNGSAGMDSRDTSDSSVDGATATGGRPALGVAPPVDGDADPGSSSGEADETGGEAPGEDVMSLLDVPGGPGQVDDEAADADDGDEPQGPPAWIAARPVPWQAAEDEAEAMDPSTPDGTDPADQAPPPAPPAIAGAPPGPDRADRAPPEREPPGPEGSEPASSEPGPPDGPPDRLTPEAESQEHAVPEPGPEGSDDGAPLPWDPAGADPPTPSGPEVTADVDPPGTPRDEAAAETGGKSETGETTEDPASNDEAAPDPPGRTSLDGLVEAAAQSPHPVSEAGGGARSVETADGSDPITPTPDPAVGSDEPEPSASTNPAKIAEDVMRVMEEDGPDEDEAPTGPGIEAPRTGSEILGTPTGGGAEPRQDNGNGSHPQTPKESPENGASTPTRAAPTPGADAGPAPQGSDDAAMRRHDPDLFGTSGRLDDVRTSLRGDGDSPHARARGEGTGSSWLDDLDGD